MKSVCPAIFVLVSTAAAFGCANKAVEKDLDREVSAQPARPMHGGVAFKGFEAIEKSQSLTDSQKRKLDDLHGKMIGEVFSIQEETAKLKGVLFETITKSPYDAAKVSSIKKRLVTLNDQKMNSMFSALNEVEKIVGQVPAEKKRDIYQSFFFEDLGPRGQERN